MRRISRPKKRDASVARVAFHGYDAPALNTARKLRLALQRLPLGSKVTSQNRSDGANWRLRFLACGQMAIPPSFGAALHSRRKPSLSAASLRTSLATPAAINASDIAAPTRAESSTVAIHNTLDPLPLSQPVNAPAAFPAASASRAPGIFGRRYGSCIKSPAAALNRP